MTTKKYNVIYADPPWIYKQKSAGRGNRSGAVDKYITGDVSDFPMNKITADNAVCFMWSTTPLLPEGLELLRLWGFKYKTYIIWEKEGLLGMGNWFRIQTEMILVGVKGKVKPFGSQEKNIQRHKAGAHSQKPHKFRTMIERAVANSFDHISGLELFARTRGGMFGDWEYDGWDVYGNQVNNSITLPA